MDNARLEFSVASAATKGARAYQEDSTKVWPRETGEGTSMVLAVLADGMGGHVSGEIASGIACDECVEHFSTSSGDPELRLSASVTASNISIQRAILLDAKLAGMGCTIVAAFLDANGLRWASVGDSSLLLFRNNQLTRLNDDHSLGALLDKQARSNLITREEALSSPNRRSLRSALTGGVIHQIDVQTSPQPLIPGDWVLVASDGLETLSGDEIATIIAAQRSADPRKLAELLLQEVEKRKIKNQDNTSIISVCVQAANAQSTTRVGSRESAARSGNSIHSADTEVLPTLLRGQIIGAVIPDSSCTPTEPLTAASALGGRSRLKSVLVLVLALLLCAAGLTWVNYTKLLLLWRNNTEGLKASSSGGSLRTIKNSTTDSGLASK